MYQKIEHDAANEHKTNHGRPKRYVLGSPESSRVKATGMFVVRWMVSATVCEYYRWHGRWHLQKHKEKLAVDQNGEPLS